GKWQLHWCKHCSVNYAKQPNNRDWVLHLYLNNFNLIVFNLNNFNNLHFHHFQRNNRSIMHLRNRWMVLRS
ncbi:MAG TPA: hypothetical protein VNF06_03565, partial [Candidatus Aquilonibacter sp.]|nr:hypothetical protein [Candidatus Aquilonibacter sp.]